MTGIINVSKKRDIGKQDLSKAKYLVSFISAKSQDAVGYAQAAEQMIKAVQSQAGFVAAYSARDQGGVGITNSYWTSVDAISDWKKDKAHTIVQERGKKHWYQWYQVQVSEIVRVYEN